MTNRQHAKRIINRIIKRETGGAVSLDDLPDLPCIMYALDEMEEIMNGDDTLLMSELENIAQDAAFELLEEEGFPI